MVVLLGRLHPALVHFPIALLVVGALGLLLPSVRRSPPAEAVMRGIFGLGAVAALVSAGSGWLFADEQFYGGSAAALLEIHRWLGLGSAGVAVVGALLLARPGGRVLGRLLACAAALGVGAGGYVGGELVYGEGHLLAAVRPEGRPVALPELVSLELAEAQPRTLGADEPIVFRRDIRPVLRRSCFKCHDSRKQKGELRLDRREDMLAGGESGPAVVPGDAQASELVRRIRLPPDDDDFMPGKGTPLTPEETALLVRWIQEGASWE